MVWKHGKMRFKDPESAHQAQTELFEAGYTWEDGSQKYKSDLYAIHWASECMNIWAIGNAKVYKHAGTERETVHQPVFVPKPVEERRKSHHYLVAQTKELNQIMEEGTKYLLANGLTYPTSKREQVTKTGKLQRLQFMAMLSFCVQAVKGTNLSPTAQLNYARTLKIGVGKDYYEMSKDWEPYRPKGRAFTQEALIQNLKHLTCTTK